MSDPKFCPQCGHKLDKDFNFCPECGAKLSNNQPNNKNVKTTLDSNTIDTSKNLSPKVIYGILIGGIALIAIIIYTSGILDSATVIEPVNNIPEQSDVSSGVNLNNMQAINDLEEKIKQNPEDYASILELAHLQNDSGLYDAAIINYKKYLAKNPEDADARVDMGACYFNLQDYPSAIKEMETALKYAPKHQIAFLNLGVVNLTAGNLEKSKEWLQKAYDINPNNEVGQRAEQLLKNH